MKKRKTRPARASKTGTVYDSALGTLDRAMRSARKNRAGLTLEQMQFARGKQHAQEGTPPVQASDNYLHGYAEGRRSLPLPQHLINWTRCTATKPDTTSPRHDGATIDLIELRRTYQRQIKERNHSATPMAWMCSDCGEKWVRRGHTDMFERIERAFRATLFEDENDGQAKSDRKAISEIYSNLKRDFDFSMSARLANLCWLAKVMSSYLV